MLGRLHAMKHPTTTLFVLGLASLALGPFTSVPGIIIGRKLSDRGVLGQIGYVLCRTITILLGAAFVCGFVAALIFPVWHH